MPSELGDAVSDGGLSRLATDYSPRPGVYDELCRADGSLRPHWEHLVRVYQGLGRKGVADRLREARRLIRDNGVTYNQAGDESGNFRPWNLDLIPLLLRSEEWSVLERGLIQRADLLNRILLDIYGKRDLMRKGLLPADLIHGYAGYHLACHGITVPGGRPLISYAADLTRDAEGQWRVVADHAQNPSGVGYALENRVVLSRVLPSLFRDSHVHRVAGFFRSMRNTLARVAPRPDEFSQIAVLTPGPMSEAYFEHAYLANYLGYTLVQGADLSVRDGALWLRTLGRLVPLHALVRRIDDQWCDPLELRDDSLLGIPGLVQAVRNGRVVLDNALGSSVLEHPGLNVFLPELCQSLLGEELLLPSLDSYWGGRDRHLEVILDGLRGGLDVFRVCKDQGRVPVAGAGLDLASGDVDALADEIRTNPRCYVARAPTRGATAPSLVSGKLEPRSTMLRSFLISETEGYTVLPGGLCRVVGANATLLGSQQLGGQAKDVWVLASEPELQETLFLGGDQIAPAVARDSDVSSRVADNLFWIGRYAERAEALVRLLRVTIIRLEEGMTRWAAESRHGCVRTLLEALTLQTQCLPGFVGEGADDLVRSPLPEMLSLISEPARIGALPQTLKALVDAAWSVRDRLSDDTWRIVGDIGQRYESLSKEPPKELSSALNQLDPLITSLVAFSALTNENMTHNEGWHFLEAGRRLERGSNLAGLLSSTLVPVIPEADEVTVVEAVLSVTDSIKTYRRRYQGETRLGPLLDLVFQDEENPRSLAYQVVSLGTLVKDMPRMESARGLTPAEKQVLKLLTDIRLTELDQLLWTNPEGDQRTQLKDQLKAVESGLAAISNALTSQYFAHEERPHNLLNGMASMEASKVGGEAGAGVE